VKNNPAAAHECFTSAVAAPSVAQAISRLRSSLDRGTLLPSIAGEGFRPLAQSSQPPRNLSIWKSSETAGKTRLLCRYALAAAGDSASAETIEALSGVVVASRIRFYVFNRRGAWHRPRHGRDHDGPPPPAPCCWR